MNITDRFIISDILDYESRNDKNIIKGLQSLDLEIIADVIMLGNKCSIDDAFEIIDGLLEKYELTEIVEMLFKELVGSTENKDTKHVSTDEIDKYSDILMQFYNELQVLDDKLDFNTFTSMSTNFMYKYAEGVRDRYIFNENKRLRDSYIDAGLMMSALGGKLKDCPQIDKDIFEKQSNKPVSLKDKVLALGGR